MSIIKEIRSTKYVGIVIHDKANLYSNGITQNAYFIYQCLEHLGMKCMFLCPDANPSKFEYRDIPLKQISLNPLEFDPSEFHTIITVTRGVTKDEYHMFKKANVFVVAFTCGNTLMHHMEDFVRGPLHKSTTTYIGKNSLCDEIWVIPSYAHSLEYISLTRAKPAYIVPHLWSPQFISETVVRFNKKTKEDLVYDYAKHTGTKIDILIVEPNVALFKNAWIPIMAAEKLHTMRPDLIENVYVFNFPEHTNSYNMIDNLSVGSKIRKFKRLPMPDIMTHFNDKRTFPVFLCHHILNSLNYVYYEALYYGWTLVHNSDDLDGCGYYYPENDLTACANAILNAYDNHNKNVELYTEKAREYLKRVDPLDPEVGKIWNGLINCGISKTIAPK
jgi:hypothetical protein